MSNIDLLTQETIEIAARRPPLIRKRPGPRFADFAVHKGEGADLLNADWTVTHLPTGRAVASEFRTFERAVDAMIEIARLRNDWSIISDDEITQDLRDKCLEIVRRFGGMMGQRADNLPVRPEFNGYLALSSTGLGTGDQRS